MTESITREGSAPLSEKGRRAKRPNRRKRAKQWTFLIEKLKLAVDGLYEMCREEQNLNGCKEALMYLQNSSRDFESLIASIHVELSWEEKEKPQAVAWEIRKSMSSPAPVVIKDASAIMNQITPLMFSEVVKAASDRKKVIAAAPAAPPPTQLQQQSPDEKRQDLTSEEAAAAAAAADDASKDEWQVVLRGRRKKSLSSLTSGSRDDLDTLERTDSTRPSNVYERLASSARRYPPTTGRGLISASSASQGSNYMCPKSAMDLPQTKASMAKMAYSRQLLWQRSQSTLIEKMKARQVRTRNADFNTAGAAAGQRPRATTDGDRRGVSAGGAPGQTKSASAGAGSDSGSRNPLTSIRETQEDERGEIIPVDPKPSASASATEAREEKEQELQQQQTQSECGGRHLQQPQPRDEDCLSFPLSNPELTSLNLEADREWREMTEEEESLAFEERSLNIEIEQEKSLSIDAELERQVEAEADALEREEEEQRARDEAEAAAEQEEAAAVAEEEPKMTPEELAEYYTRWRNELLAEITSASWSEMVERDLAAANPTTQYLREPGDAALRHERMMSPSRKREELSEEALSRRHEQKQRRADELRERLKEEKAARLKALLQKVEEVREKRAALIERKRALMENRLRTANANRERNLEEIVRRAREDEMKVMEAQLIHTLEKGNMRLDQQKREQRNESRRQEMKEERAKKQEEKAAKEAAVEERRKMNDTRSECSALSVCDETLPEEEREEEQRVETPARIEEENLVNEEPSRPEEEKCVEQAVVKVAVEEYGNEEDDDKVIKDQEEIKDQKEREGDKKQKRRKNIKEQKKEEEEVREEEETVVEDYDWKKVIDDWTAGDAMLADDSDTTRRYRCAQCAIELRSEWEAVTHVMSGGHGGVEEKKEEEEQKKKKRKEGRKERVISLVSALQVSVVKQELVRKESVSAKNKKRKMRRGEMARAKESVEAIARAVGGGHGPSVDLWRELLTAMEIPVLGEEMMKEVTIFGKRNAARKKPAEAMAGFLEEHAGGREGGLLDTVLDATLRAITSERSIRVSGARREEREARDIEDAAWCMLRCLAREREQDFQRLISSSNVRALRLATVLLQRVDAAKGERKALKRVAVAAPAGNGRAGGAAAAGPVMTSLQPVVFELLQRMAAAGGAAQAALCLLEAPRRVATLPIAHLLQPPNRHIMMAALVAITRQSAEALRDLKQHLSPWHVVQFLKSELDRAKCICPLHTVLPTRESITEAIQYYELAIP